MRATRSCSIGIRRSSVSERALGRGTGTKVPGGQPGTRAPNTRFGTRAIGFSASSQPPPAFSFACHSPEVVRAKGLGQQPLVRTDFREVGVDCMVCHTNLQGKVHAPFKTDEVPHGIEVDPQHATEALCASCHGAFGTVAEFQKTTFKKQGQTCQTCHMPKVLRPIATGGKPKMVARHLWKGGDDPEMLKKAVKLDATVQPDGTVVAKVANVGAGHRFPTGTH